MKQLIQEFIKTYPAGYQTRAEIATAYSNVRANPFPWHFATKKKA